MNINISAESQLSKQLGYTPVVGQSIHQACAKHHKTLFFCWNIRAGIDLEIDIDRIVAYVAWYGENILLPKIEIEEKLILTVLSEEHYLAKRAIKEHRRIKRLLKIDNKNPMKNLICIEEELDLHIRFEERNILTEVEKSATQKQLKAINDAFEQLPTNADWEDQFWN